MKLHYLVVLGALVAQVRTASSVQPFAMAWSDETFGPDGPWQTLKISIRKPPHEVALYPGGTFRSHLLTPKIFSNTTLSPNACFASAGGLYNIETSISAVARAIRFPAATDYTHGGLRIEGPKVAAAALYQMSIGTSNGSRNTFSVPNVTLALHDDIGLVYPDGAIHPLQVGTLALGYLGTESQSFSEANQPSINGSLIPGYLQAVNITSSNSFGLHIGSAKLKIEGSLYFGGYDKSRIAGPISTQRGPFAGVEPDDNGKAGLIDLLNIGIYVFEGSSPFNTTSINNLLAAGNSSILPALPLPLLPEAPYLDLPQSTCDAIAAWLPVTYSSHLGLYTWNILDPLYTRIITSPSVLSFTFRKDQLKSQNITISVPFMLLNLTLEPPLVGSSIAYFPCNAQAGGRYSLGRAFLQAAFVGANWNANNNQGVWWLAQAPGPNIGSQNNVTVIHDEDVSISSSLNSWVGSWKDIWTPLIDSAANTTVLDPPPSSSISNILDEGPSSGLSAASKGGIGAGVALCGILVILLCAFLYSKKSSRIHVAPMKDISTARTTMSDIMGIESPMSIYRDAGWGPVELNSEEVKINPHEMDSRETTPRGIGIPLCELGG